MKSKKNKNKHKKEKKRKNKLKIVNEFIIVGISLIIAFIFIFAGFLIQENKKNKKNKDNENLNTKNKIGEHYNSTALNSYFYNLTRKYYFLTENSTIEDCEKINITKERILCKTYVKMKKMNIEMYKPYLIFALIEKRIISTKEAVEKYNIPKEKIAEALDNPKYCLGDEKCLKVYRSFKKNYRNLDVVKQNIKIAWIYYKKGLLNIENFTNPYNYTDKNTKKINNIEGRGCNGSSCPFTKP